MSQAGEESASWQQTADALSRERRTTQLYLDLAGVIFVALDPGGCVTLINRMGCEILGFTEAEIVGRNWFEHFVPLAQRASVREVFEALIGGAVAGCERVENRVVTASGEERLIAWHNAVVRDEHGEVAGTLSSGEDVTDRRRAEAALVETQARAQAILETTVDGVITIDDEGRIESFNPAAERLFGYAAADVIGLPLSLLMPPPYRDEHDHYLRTYLETGRPKVIGRRREVTGLRRDGSLFPMDLSVSEVQAGARRFFTGIVRDASERRRLEREILDISEQERQRIGRDLHDGLGSHLTGLAMRLQALARGAAAGRVVPPKDLEELAELVEEGSEQARALSRGLNPVKLEVEGLPAALQELAAGIETISGVRCSFERTTELPALPDAVAVQLYRIAQEAAGNAARHARANHISIRLGVEGGRLALAVRDDGVGMPEQIDAGRGMGLHIMPYRAHRIGAVFTVGRLRRGTLVSCALPLDGLPPADTARDGTNEP